MTYILKVSLTARKDTLEAFEYYESVQTGPGDQFIADLEEKYSMVAKNPLAYSYAEPKRSLRDVALKRFPYLIIFRIKGSVISVLSIHNRHKTPKSF